MTRKYIRIAELIYKDKIGELTGQEKQELLAWKNLILIGRYSMN